MKKAVIAGFWVLATVSLSRMIHAGRTFGVAHGEVGYWLSTLVWLALLVGSVFVLMLRTYAIERQHGRVVRQVRVFERILGRGDDGVA